MKTYLKPELSILEIHIELNILAGSGGVNNGDTVGNSFNSDDVTYSRNSSFWDDEE